MGGCGLGILTQNSVGEGVLVIPKPEKESFLNDVPTCVLLRKKFRDGVQARSVTIIPLVLTVFTIYLMDQERTVTHAFLLTLSSITYRTTISGKYVCVLTNCPPASFLSA
jgi:hypothetical protein